MLPAPTNRILDGVVLLDKPLGLSSNHALQRVKRLFGARKAGHSGSLDPLATGMLPICFGKSTKLSATLLDARKCYRFTIHLGTRTSTGDREGEPVETAAVPELDAARIQAVLQAFTGSLQQVPPMYSALKHKGQRLYALARQGIEVAREPRSIHIDLLESEGWSTPELTLQAVCSKGTYIRVLAEDIAKALGSCGHVSLLRRLWVEPFREEQMVTLETLEGAADWAARDRWCVQEAIPSTIKQL